MQRLRIASLRNSVFNVARLSHRLLHGLQSLGSDASHLHWFVECLRLGKEAVSWSRGSVLRAYSEIHGSLLRFTTCIG